MGFLVDRLVLNVRMTGRPKLRADDRTLRRALLSGDDAQLTEMLATERRTLDATTRARMVGFLGDELADVVIFAGPMSGALARGIQAEAFSQGRFLFFDPRHFRPDTPKGEALVAHELTHALQFAEEDTGSERQKEARALATEAAYLDRLAPGTMPLALDVGGEPSAKAIASPDPAEPWHQAAGAGIAMGAMRANLGRQLKKSAGPRADTAKFEQRVASVLAKARELLGESTCVEEDRIGQLKRYFLGPLQ